MSKFKVGDRVKCVSKILSFTTKNEIGTVIDYGKKRMCAYGVRFDNNVGGHNLTNSENHCEQGHGVYVQEKDLELAYDKSIHITTDGTTTVSVLKDGKNIVKRAEAKLSTRDSFDFKTGAEIAFNRLFGIEPKKEPASDKKDGPKFKVGDKVVVLDGSKIDKYRGSWVCDMGKYVGEQFEVKEIIKPTEFCSSYGYKLKCEEYAWDERGLELVTSVPQVKEVKRKAEVGEWVKVVNASGTEDDEYENGDILEIIKIDEGRAYYRDSQWKYLDKEEYVVLENYKPQEKTYTQEELESAIKAEREKIYAEVKNIFEKGE